MEKMVKLFEPGKIGRMELRNRITMAPVGLRLGTEPGGYVTDRSIAFYGARARGGVSLIHMSVQAVAGRLASGRYFATGTLDVTDEEHLPSAQRWNQAMHAFGAKTSFNVSHHGLVIALSLMRRPPEQRLGVRVLAPSAQYHAQGGQMAHALTVDEIQELVEEFAQGARRGKAAGFDSVRVQGCHGYLIHQFLSPRTNKRKDEYGGSLKNRARFACEIISRVRAEVGPDYPIIFRMNGEDFLEGGITLDQALEQAPLFVEAGADCLDISTGPFETHHWQFTTMYQPFAPLGRAAAAIKKEVKVPVMVAAKIDVEHGERLLQDGAADFINMARPLFADPELPNKAKEGRLEDINRCIYCAHCQDRRTDDPVMCTVNPAIGKELEKLEPAQKPKKVMVIGGGLAGMQAARTLAERGHMTSLYEKSDKLGGQWNFPSAHRPELGSLVRSLSKGMDKAGVKVHLNKEVTRPMVEEAKPDAVVVATGAIPVTLDVPGIDSKKVVQANDVLTGRVKVGQEVVVIGGRMVGLDTATFLAQQGKKVSVVEMLDILWEVQHNLKLALLENAIKAGVYMYPHSRLDSVTENGVNIIWDGGESPVKGGPRYELLFLKADTVVLAVGSKKEDRLGEQLKGSITEVYIIGDCAEVRDALAATQEGYAIGRKI